MSQLQSKILTDTWVKATWDDYLDAAKTLETAKGYYYNGHYRLEIAPIGNDHACDHTIIMYAVNLYGTIQKIDFSGRDNCSYRKAGYREAQPDASYYIGDKANLIPYDTSIINLDRYLAPDLVIEISKSTLGDDLGNKRLLYEELGISEYWVVDVQNAQVIAFKMIEQGSQRIHTSQTLPGLKINLLNEALQRSRQSNHSQVGQWLLQVFQVNP
jgi:Uma2 family endonuclease